VSRSALRLLFIALGLCWLGFVLFDALTSVIGDCFDNQWCQGRKSIALSLVFWRESAVALMLVLTYRFFRRDKDVL
jgi:hypothetical protein